MTLSPVQIHCILPHLLSVLRLVSHNVRRARGWVNPEVNNEMWRSALMTKGVQRSQ
jgi:hypothetical protein